MVDYPGQWSAPSWAGSPVGHSFASGRAEITAGVGLYNQLLDWIATTAPGLQGLSASDYGRTLQVPRVQDRRHHDRAVEGEQGEVAATEAAWTWIKAVRGASNTLEASLPADFADDAHWPEAP